MLCVWLIAVQCLYFLWHFFWRGKWAANNKKQHWCFWQWKMWKYFDEEKTIYGNSNLNEGWCNCGDQLIMLSSILWKINIWIKLQPFIYFFMGLLFQKLTEESIKTQLSIALNSSLIPADHFHWCHSRISKAKRNFPSNSSKIHSTNGAVLNHTVNDFL